jgi:hypothetical protein
VWLQFGKPRLSPEITRVASLWFSPEVTRLASLWFSPEVTRMASLWFSPEVKLVASLWEATVQSRDNTCGFTLVQSRGNTCGFTLVQSRGDTCGFTLVQSRGNMCGFSLGSHGSVPRRHVWLQFGKPRFAHTIIAYSLNVSVSVSSLPLTPPHPVPKSLAINSRADECDVKARMSSMTARRG